MPASAPPSQKQPYLLGDHFTEADVLIASMAEFMRTVLPAGEPIDPTSRAASTVPPLPARGPGTPVELGVAGEAEYGRRAAVVLAPGYSSRKGMKPP